MEKWRECWRQAIAPNATLEELKGLKTELMKPNPRICTDEIATRYHPCTPVLTTCIIGFLGWQGLQQNTLNKVLDYYYRLSEKAKNVSPQGIDTFVNWFDETPLEQSLPKVLEEVTRSIHQREEV